MDKINYVRDNEELYRSVRGKLEDKKYILNEGNLEFSLKLLVIGIGHHLQTEQFLEPV